MKHLTKAGGTFLRLLFDAVIKPYPGVDGQKPSSRFQYTNDDTPINPKRPGKKIWERPFIVVTMRNICDLYLSFASFGPGKAFAYGVNQTSGPFPFGAKGNKIPQPITPENLKLWMLNARRTYTHAGFYSFYFHGEVVAPECNFNRVHTKSFQMPNPKEQELTAACDRNATRIYEDLRTYDPMTFARCWLFHETLLDDVRECLKVYEKESAWTQDSINWERFEVIANNKTEQFLLLGSKAHEKMAGGATETHASCKEIFPPGGEMEALVKETDPWMFDKLGYSGCCTPSSHMSLSSSSAP